MSMDVSASPQVTTSHRMLVETWPQLTVRGYRLTRLKGWAQTEACHPCSSVCIPNFRHAHSTRQSSPCRVAGRRAPTAPTACACGSAIAVAEYIQHWPLPAGPAFIGLCLLALHSLAYACWLFAACWLCIGPRMLAARYHWPLRNDISLISSTC